MSFKYLGREINTGSIEFTVSKEDFEKYVEKAYQKNKGKFNITGFRKGKAPRKLIEKQYGEGVFYDDALNIILPEEYDNAVNELNLEPVDRPDIDITSIGKETDLTFIAKVTLKPEVILGDYSSIEIKKIESEVTEEQINEELKKMQSQNARMISVNRPAALNDIVTIDYSGFMGDTMFDGGSAKNQTLTIGENKFIPGFEEQIIGKEIGSDFQIAVTFPIDYHAEELKGKEVQFEIYLHDIKEKQLPELNDDFAMESSEFDTLEELKNSLKKKMEESNKASVENYIKNSALDQVVNRSTIELPDPMVESEIDYMIKDFEYQLMYQGIDFNQYMDITGSKLDDIKDQMRDDAKKRVLGSLVIEAVANKENVTVDMEEVDKEIEHLANMYSKSIEETRAVYAKDNFEYIKDSIRTRKTVELIAANVKFVE
jgi:trigger factor